MRWHRRPALRIVVVLAAVAVMLALGEVGPARVRGFWAGPWAGGGAAFAVDDPPDVRGLSPAAAQQAVLNWDKSAVISFSPALSELPPGTDASTVVAVRAIRASQPQFTAAAAPVVIDLGTVVPDLAGDTRTTASDELARHGLRLAARPVDAPPDWLVDGQEVAPGTVVGFRGPVAVFLVAPVVVTTPPRPVPPARPSIGPRVALVAGSSAAAVVLLALLGVVALRRTRRRRQPPRLERVEARPHAGQLIGPDLIERETGPGRPGTVGVRLEPRYDPGTFEIQQSPL